MQLKIYYIEPPKDTKEEIRRKQELLRMQLKIDSFLHDKVNCIKLMQKILSEPETT